VQFTGCTLGIIGMGRIGEIIAKHCKSFKIRTLYYNRNQKSKETEEQLNVQYCSLDDLLMQSDFVVIICPSTPKTAKMIGKEQLQKMKKTAFLINIARGSIVDQDALVSSLLNNEIAGAALDVTGTKFT
jgi:lactate dehydrogenase-like 2-hydroxyacid dehydrogenase